MKAIHVEPMKPLSFQSSSMAMGLPTVRSLARTLTLVLCIAAFATAQVSVTTFHNDNFRSGQNVQETVLTPGNVNSNLFGKLFSTTVDGFVYAQPLYMPNVQNIAGGTHNVLYVATEHDSLYAINADSGAVLWQTSFINPADGITSVSSSDVSCSDTAGDWHHQHAGHRSHHEHSLSGGEDEGERSLLPASARH